MKFQNRYQLEKYLAREVLGKQLPQRKPPRSQTRNGPPRDPQYLAWIRALPSVISGQQPCEAAHTGTDGGMGQKASDYSALPLTPAEHREYHQRGKPAFERRHRVNCAHLAARLNAEWNMIQRRKTA